ncbi:hypothetical protein OIU83_00995 [Flavobacterium sp. LS1R49]|uniref:Auto-transporter adhesin head GIN domain-containing protein n=1 Tax=Flavobacterium shii TaxID=2987687 RepID=A0A9X2ZB01_9FLAO|nr:hypothetical protein [Flavobacterium shii]MCV9926212.1 hypothetical protein [Flavobacterium shii]
MKVLFILFSLFMFTGLHSQTNEAAYFLDGNFVHKNTIANFDVNEIKNINVIKDTIRIEAVNYAGRIMITSKNPKNINLMSLKDIKNKFTKSKSKKVLFVLNGVLILNDVGTYKIDEKYIFKTDVVSSDTIENLQGIDLDIVSILTKIKENTEPKILIRGNDISNSLK